MPDLFNKDNGAKFSADRKFRLELWRVWDQEKPKAMCIGLNPSTANENKNDHTIRILQKVLNHLGFGGFVMMNCFPLISSKPEALQGIDIDDCENTGNHYAFSDNAAQVSEVIFAWGNFEIVSERGMDKRLQEMFPNAKCFGKNKNGTPMHPRALSYNKKINSPELIPYGAQ